METKPKSKLSAILDVVLPAVFAVLAIMSIRRALGARK